MPSLLLKKNVDIHHSKIPQAAGHGNIEASVRLRALRQQHPEALSRQQHNTLTQNNLVRKRTQARIDSNAAGLRIASSSVAAGGGAALAAAQSAVNTTSKISQQPSNASPPISPPANPRKRFPANARSPSGQVQNGPARSAPPPATPPAKKEYSTFEEMGYQSAALDNKECKIM